MTLVVAEVKFIDGAGRAVCQTETNEAALISDFKGKKIAVGDKILIKRTEPPLNNRVTDWRIDS